MKQKEFTMKVVGKLQKPSEAYSESQMKNICCQVLDGINEIHKFDTRFLEGNEIEEELIRHFNYLWDRDNVELEGNLIKTMDELYPEVDWESLIREDSNA